MFDFIRYIFDWKWDEVEVHEKTYDGLKLPNVTETSDYMRKRINNSFLYFIEECAYAINGYEKNASKQQILNSFKSILESPVESKKQYTRDIAKAYWILRFKIPKLKNEMDLLKKENNDLWVNKEEHIRYLEFQASTLISKHIRSLWT